MLLDNRNCSKMILHIRFLVKKQTISRNTRSVKRLGKVFKARRRPACKKKKRCKSNRSESLKPLQQRFARPLSIITMVVGNGSSFTVEECYFFF